MRDAQIASMDQSLKRLHERVDIPPPNEKWEFIQQLMDKIEKQDKEIIVLRSKYKRAKAIMTSHGISSSEVLGEITISG